MFLKLFDTAAAVKLGGELADELTPARPTKGSPAQARELQGFLQRVDTEVRPLKLGWFGRARLANAFKWKLRETGFAPDVVDELTHMLLVRSSGAGVAATAAGKPTSITPNRAMRRRMAKKR